MDAVPRLVSSHLCGYGRNASAENEERHSYDKIPQHVQSPKDNNRISVFRGNNYFYFIYSMSIAFIG